MTFFFFFLHLYTREPPAGFQKETRLWYLWNEKAKGGETHLSYLWKEKAKGGETSDNTSKQSIWKELIDRRLYDSIHLI